MKAIILLLLVACVSGCGLFKKSVKSNEVSKVETKQSIQKDSSSLKVDKSVIIEKSKADTTVLTPEAKVKQKTTMNMDSLVKGISAIKSDLVDVRLKLDPNTGLLTTEATLKPQKVPFKFDKEKTTFNDVTEAVDKQEKTSNESKEEDKKSVKQKEPTNMVIWLGFFILIAGGIFLLVRKN